MFSTEQRRIAIETFIKYGHSYADTIAELGYPNRATLRLWWGEYESTGEIPEGRGTRRSKYTDEQMRAAVDHYLEHGRSLSRTMRALGYSKGRQTLCGRYRLVLALHDGMQTVLYGLCAAGFALVVRAGRNGRRVGTAWLALCGFFVPRVLGQHIVCKKRDGLLPQSAMWHLTFGGNAFAWLVSFT